MADSRRIFLIDGSALAYRSHFAFIRRPLISSKGMNTSAAFGFVTLLLKLREEQSPDLMVVVFDAPHLPSKPYRSWGTERVYVAEDRGDFISLQHILTMVFIDENGEQAGIVNTDDARRRAASVNLDLVEVSPRAEPPVCSIMDFGKFKYAQKKKERGGKKVHSALKELRVRPAIDKHDLEYRLVQGRKFLEEGHKVQVVCIFRGRQRAHPEIALKVMDTVANTLGDISKVEVPPKMNGPRMTMLLARKA